MPNLTREIEIRYKSKSTNVGTRVNRSPIRILIDVQYDHEGQFIQLRNLGAYVGEVYLYNSNGEEVEYSPNIECMLYPDSEDLYRLVIVGESWVGESEIVVE